MVDQRRVRNQHLRIRVCMYVCIKKGYVYMYVCMYAQKKRPRIHVCMHEKGCVDMYVCTQKKGVEGSKVHMRMHSKCTCAGTYMCLSMCKENLHIYVHP